MIRLYHRHTPVIWIVFSPPLSINATIMTKPKQSATLSLFYCILSFCQFSWSISHWFVSNKPGSLLQNTNTISLQTTKLRIYHHLPNHKALLSHITFYGFSFKSYEFFPLAPKLLTFTTHHHPFTLFDLCVCVSILFSHFHLHNNFNEILISFWSNYQQQKIVKIFTSHPQCFLYKINGKSVIFCSNSASLCVRIVWLGTQFKLKKAR